MLSSIEKMLAALEQNEIVYCHWKSNEHLRDALNGDTDLDMLFDPTQRIALEQVLDQCGLKRFRATPLMQYNGIEDFIGFDETTAKIWHLHTHYRMTMGEKHLKGYTITPWGSQILSRRRKSEEGIHCSSIEDELLLLLCRIALKLRWRDMGRKLGKDDRTELQWLIEHYDKEHLKAIAPDIVGEKATAIVDAMLNKTLSKKGEFRKLRRQLLKEFKIYTGFSSLGSRWMRTKRELFWIWGGLKRRMGWNNYSASRRISPAGGTVITFLGCDGAGKSTTLKYVRKELNKKLDVATIYFGSGDGSSSLIRKPMKLVANKVGGKGLGHSVEKEYSEKKRVSLKSRLYSCAKIIWAMTLANEKKRKLRQMTKARNNGLIVLTDRYPQTITPGCSDGPLLARYKESKGLLRRLALKEERIYHLAERNAPDMVVKLTVPTEVAIERKPEMTTEEIERKKAIVMALNISDNTIVIDTSHPFAETSSQIMKEIWRII